MMVASKKMERANISSNRKVQFGVFACSSLLLVSCAFAFSPASRQGVNGGVKAAKGRRSVALQANFLDNLFRRRGPQPETEDVSLCIIGGGVSGLTAAITAAESLAGTEKVVLLEASPTLGGRVQSDSTDDGYVLDRGFAVFIEEYPFSKKILNYDSLKLGKFLPGALVKTAGQVELGRVADPLRVPGDIFVAITAPVGTFVDKVKILLLLFNVFTKSVEKLFEEPETDTLTCLKERYGFSDKFIGEFFEPFLEGIYLAPLEEQSSRMFHFVFKMFSEGSATLPRGGMGAVANQLVGKASSVGVDVRVGDAVSRLSKGGDDEGRFIVDTASEQIRAKSVVVATDVGVTQKLLAGVSGLESLETAEEQPQREVGCLYYGFKTEVPVKDPILILNGVIGERGTTQAPVNNCCFPSVVNSGYAPEGCNLCSVTVLKKSMDEYRGRDDELDAAVRAQLATWFPDQADAIKSTWELKGKYDIRNAQPAQLKGPTPANVNRGRNCAFYRDTPLPKGLFLCGDHMATATLNGALESGENAGEAAASAIE